jgi:ribosome-binding ATPase YchF (GTP1/OBG family)
MKISVFSIPEIIPGKYNVKDPRLDQFDSITKSKKKTPVQVELVAEEHALDADAILAAKEARTDLVLRDLEFVETRLSRCESENERNLLNKLKTFLEREEFISAHDFNDEERKIVSVYGLFTNKAVTLAQEQEGEDLNSLLTRVLRESGYISFFTGVGGGSESRAWLIKKGTTAWEAAGAIHSDIQRGFIRAEIISFADFIQSGSEAQAKQAGRMRLEQKDYVMQDADIVNFRFNK